MKFLQKICLVELFLNGSFTHCNGLVTGVFSSDPLVNNVSVLCKFIDLSDPYSAVEGTAFADLNKIKKRRREKVDEKGNPGKNVQFPRPDMFKTEIEYRPYKQDRPNQVGYHIIPHDCLLDLIFFGWFHLSSMSPDRRVIDENNSAIKIVEFRWF